MIPESCPAYILAGGVGSRFGSDKGRAEVLGTPQIVRLYQLLLQLGHTVYVVADRCDRYEEFKIDCLVDQVNNHGPIAGLATALTHRKQSTGAGWLLLVGCDQVVWKHAWWQLLSKPLSQSDKQPALAVTFRAEGSDGKSFPQPIPGLYHSDLLPFITSQLASESLSLRRMLADVHSEYCVGTSNPRDWSFNSREEFDRIVQRLEAAN